VTFAAILGAADRAVLQHLGGTVRYVPGVGPAIDVRGVFEASYVRADAGDAGVASSGPVVFLQLADLPLDPAEDDPTITVEGVSYKLREPPRKDGAGGVLLFLHRIVAV
jgi:hypothetical protein